MASPPGTGVLHHMLLSTTKTSRISEEALSDEDIQQLPMEEDYSQLRRGERGNERPLKMAPKLAWLQPHRDTLVDRTTRTRSSHL